MVKPKSKVPETVIFLVSIVFLTSCQTFFGPTATLPSSELVYDNRSDVIVVHVDIHYPGVPRPTMSVDDCYRIFLPTLRIWGDGLVYYNESWGNVDRSAVLSGTIGSDKLKGILNYLNSQHFFTAWEHEDINPAGTLLKIGAQLMHRPAVEYETGELIPAVYIKLINTLKPELVSINDQKTIDPRIESILIEYNGCNKY